MTLEVSIISILFFALIAHSMLSYKKDFYFKWSLLKKYFMLIFPLYLLSWDIDYGLKIGTAFVIATTIVTEFLKLKRNFKLTLNLISIMVIIWGINSIPEGVTTLSYIGISFIFGAFFTLFFDSILLYRPYFRFRIIFLLLGYILMFHCLWSTIEMGIGNS